MATFCRFLTISNSTSAPPPVSPPSATTTATTIKPTIAFTTPSNYSTRFSQILSQKGFNPLSCPSITIQISPHTQSTFTPYLTSPQPGSPAPLHHFDAIAFTSRTAISAFSAAASQLKNPPLPSSGHPFIISALGQDSTLLNKEFIATVCDNPERISILVPPVATPKAMVEALGYGHGKRILCPVPLVVDLEEPPVVPNFLRDLEVNGWVVGKAYGYETRWAGPECGKVLLENMETIGAIVFTSSGEVEGLLRGLERMGFDWGMLRRRFSNFIVAAHGPVTAEGAARLGVEVDVVSEKFESFEGVVDALDQILKA